MIRRNSVVRSSPQGLFAQNALLNPRNPWQAVAVAVLVAILASACAKPAVPAKPPVAVTVATAERGDAPYLIVANGIVEPLQTVAIQSQVGGVLTAVHFKEGDAVKQGQVLFVIDPRPFKAALDQAVAGLARDQAQLVSAQNDADRYSALVLKDFVTKSQADQAVASAAAAKAVVEADKATIDNAKFNLENATITAPISGKTGGLLVKQGNLVKPGAAPALVVINQIQPILVHFSVPDREFPNIQKYAAAGELKVRATPRGGEAPEQGSLNFLDNSVDTTTGAITIKAQFENKQGRLWPGQFVQVALQLYVDQNAVFVPNTAVQMGQDGQFVYVVDKDLKAVLQPVTVGRVIGDRTVIATGLEVGSRVVTDGQSRLTPNAKVEIIVPGVEKAAGKAAEKSAGAKSVVAP
jgi:multidrug efflux system membrane fusion protein